MGDLAALRKQAAEAGALDYSAYVQWLEARLIEAAESTKEADEDETTP